MHARLKTYRDTHNGSCNVPYRYPEDSKLGRWVWTQRSELRKYEKDPETSTLSAERISALEQMGAIKSWIKFSESSASASASSAYASEIIYLCDSDSDDEGELPDTESKAYWV